MSSNKSKITWYSSEIIIRKKEEEKQNLKIPNCLQVLEPPIGLLGHNITIPWVDIYCLWNYLIDNQITSKRDFSFTKTLVYSSHQLLPVLQNQNVSADHKWLHKS